MRLDADTRTLGDLTGRTVLVTGASSGIGAAVVTRFLAAGARVHGVARRRDEMERRWAAERAAERFVPHPLDVSDGDAVQALMDRLAATDPVDTLVLAAGRNVNPRTFGEVSFEAFDDLMRVNLSGVFYFLRAGIDQLRDSRGDAVIVSSVSALWPDHSGPAYQASKAALVALARGVARDEHANGVRVTTVMPAFVNTPIVDRRPVPPPPGLRSLFIQPEDVAETALAAITIPGRTTVSEITLTATRIQSIGNTQNANPEIPESLRGELGLEA
jgi:NAD(P)-dependent dehydrogenase (short-subunit alcohol dehydrogenase family)